MYNQLESSLSLAGFFESDDSNTNSKSQRLINSCIVSARAPSQLARVKRGAIKYTETVDGAIEKEGVAADLKLFTRSSQTTESSVKEYHGIDEERVFRHPSSFNFSKSTYSCPWIVYHGLLRTTKVFNKDVTECRAYALLFFGGDITVLVASNMILVDGQVRLTANPRIGALIGGLRRKMDELLLEKIETPSMALASTVIKLFVKLNLSDGLQVLFMNIVQRDEISPEDVGHTKEAHHDDMGLFCMFKKSYCA